MTTFDACADSEIEEGSMRKFTSGTREILLGRRNGVLFACDNACPHKYASLHKGYYKGDNLVCYMHDYEFDTSTGRLVNMKSWKKSDTWMEQSPEWRKSGNLTMHPVVVRDGRILVELD